MKKRVGKEKGKKSKLSIISFILTLIYLIGYISFFIWKDFNFALIIYYLVFFILPIITIILSIVSLLFIRRYKLRGRNFALSSLIISIAWFIILVIHAIYIIFWVITK